MGTASTNNNSINNSSNTIAINYNTKSRPRCNSTNVWVVIIIIFVVFSTFVNFLHSQYAPTNATTPKFLQQFVIGRGINTNDNNRQQQPKKQQHQLAGLSCDRYGGPERSVVENEMVYWSDIPSDYTYQSPFHRANTKDGTEKFLTFEPDHGCVKKKCAKVSCFCSIHK